MATTYLRLWDPVFGFQQKNGAVNAAGRVYVYYDQTDDLAPVYDDGGTQLAQPLVLDDNGRSQGPFVNASGVYWVKVCDQFDAELYTVEKMTPCGGGGGSILGQVIEITSSDGTISVDKIVEGHTTTFDLSTDSGDPAVLKTSSNVLLADGEFAMQEAELVSGNRIRVQNSQIKADKGWYHYTANVDFRCDQPVNVTAPVMVYGPDDAVVGSFDMTYEHSETLSVSGDVRVNYDNKPLVFRVANMATGMYCAIASVSVHAIARVVNVGGGGGGDQVQSDWTCNDVDDPAYILHKPEELAASLDSGTELIAGQNITFTESAQGLTISAAGGSSVVIGYVDL